MKKYISIVKFCEEHAFSGCNFEVFQIDSTYYEYANFIYKVTAKTTCCMMIEANKYIEIFVELTGYKN